MTPWWHARVAVPAIVTMLLAASGALADDGGASPPANPLPMLEEAAAAIPGYDGGPGGIVKLLVLLTVLGVAPSILVLCTSFARIMIVLTLLRQALGSPGLPPNQVLAGLSLLLTVVVMSPTLDRMYTEGVAPYVAGEETSYVVAWDHTKAPLRQYMFCQIEASGNWSSLYMMLEQRGVDTSEPERIGREDVDMLSLVPAFVLSELKTAFIIGFRIYLPFLVIDLVISSMLVSMGMLMLPPVLISLPFKLLLFILVDGWTLVIGALLSGVARPDLAVVAVSLLAGGVP